VDHMLYDHGYSNSNNPEEQPYMDKNMFANHEKVLYYTIDAHKLDYELKKLSKKHRGLQEEHERLTQKNTE